MSETNLSCTFTKEQISAIEERMVGLSNGETTNLFVSIATGLCSAIMSDIHSRPADMENLFALTEVYGNITKKTYGISDKAVEIEMMRIYQKMDEQIQEFDARMAAMNAAKDEESENLVNDEMPVSEKIEPIPPIETEVLEGASEPTKSDEDDSAEQEPSMTREQAEAAEIRKSYTPVPSVNCSEG